MSGAKPFFCVICSSSLNHWSMGSSDPSALQRRRERVEKIRRRREGGDSDGDSDEDFSDFPVLHGEHYDEDTSYDPGILSSADLEWLGQLGVLGYNPSWAGAEKAFIDDNVYYLERSAVVSYSPWTDTIRAPYKGRYKCYYQHNPFLWPVYPFHFSCLSILCRALTGSTDIRNIDKELLYSAMAMSDPRDYGDISGTEDEWESVPGEEYSVSDPQKSPRMLHLLEEKLEDKAYTLPGKTLDLGAKVSNDPFRNFPYDILCELFGYLSGKSLLSLLIASWEVYRATINNAFWRRRIHLDMPWFWELHEIMMDPKFNSLNFKQVYLWLDRETTASYGMEGQFLNIANRRRIWKPCEQIADMYNKRINPEEATKSATASEILRGTYCRRMVTVFYPVPAVSPTTASAQWLCYWEESEELASAIYTFWRIDGTLVGMGVTFGTNRRLFGHCESASEVHTFEIERGHWIQKLKFYFPRSRWGIRGSHNAIGGVRVYLPSGRSQALGNTRGPSREIQVSGENKLVGIRGEITEDGSISRLGILESAHPNASRDPSDGQGKGFQRAYDCVPRETRVPTIETLLWAEDHGNYFPHQVRILEFPVPDALSTPNDHPIEFVPHVVCAWKRKNWGCKLKMISVYSGLDSHDAKSILGFEVEYQKESYYRAPSKEMHPSVFKKGPDAIRQDFDVDGHGGEEITEVQVGRKSGSRVVGLKFRTNRERTGHLGEKHEDIQWQSQCASQGETFWGLILGFGTGSDRILTPDDHIDRPALCSIMAFSMEI